MREVIAIVIFVYAVMSAPAAGIVLWHSMKQQPVDRACYSAECEVTNDDTIQCREPQRRDCP
jgi:hypothetical protein